MCAGPAPPPDCAPRYRQEYRRCLEREFRRGRAGPCSDPAFAERLRRRLRAEPALLAALQEDGPALLARGLRGRPDPAAALRGLAEAFRLLELAAANLYLCPWRREFGTVQTFSGTYVHSLRPALPEADLLRSFGRLGYEPCERHLLAVARPLPGPQLAAAACGFFACRLECGILAEVVRRLQPRRPPARDLLEARRLAGDVAACVEMLGTGPGPAAARAEASGGLYTQMPTSPEGVGGEDVTPPPLWRDPDSTRGAEDEPRRGWDLYGAAEDEPRRDWDPRGAAEDEPRKDWDPRGATEDGPRRDWDLYGAAEDEPRRGWGPRGAAEDGPRKDWDPRGAAEHRQEPVHPTSNRNPDASSPSSSSSSRLFLEQELGGTGNPLSVGTKSSQILGELQDLVPPAPQEAPELPCYQLHSCLRRGALPSYCCSTCQQLHAGGCAAGQACRSRHRGQELRGERQQRLWLQRTELDMLLADSSGPWA